MTVAPLALTIALFTLQAVEPGANSLATLTWNTTRHGKIVASHGDGIRGAHIWLHRGSWKRHLVSGGAGRFVIPPLLAGDYRLSARAAGHTGISEVPLHWPPEEDLLGFTLRLKAPGIIEGSLDQGRSNSGLWVAVDYGGSEAVAQQVPVDATGHFRFEGVAAGSTRLRLFGMSPDFKSLDTSPYIPASVKGKTSWHTPHLDELFKSIGEPLTVEVRAGQTVSVHFGPPPLTAIRLHGKLHDERTAKGSSSLILAAKSGSAWKQSAWIQADGAFETVVPSKGTYLVYWMNGLRGLHCTPWQVEISGASEQMVNWAPPSGSLRIRTLDDEGQPLLLSDDALFTPVLELHSRGTPLRGIRADRTTPGEILYRNLAPGPYVLRGTSHEFIPEEQRWWKHTHSTPLWILSPQLELLIEDEPLELEAHLTLDDQASGK